MLAAGRQRRARAAGGSQPSCRLCCPLRWARRCWESAAGEERTGHWDGRRRRPRRERCSHSISCEWPPGVHGELDGAEVDAHRLSSFIAQENLDRQNAERQGIGFAEFFFGDGRIGAGLDGDSHAVVAVVRQRIVRARSGRRLRLRLRFRPGLRRRKGLGKCADGDEASYQKLSCRRFIWCFRCRKIAGSCACFPAADTIIPRLRVEK